MQGRITMKKLISIFIILACFVSKSEGSAIERLYLESRLIDKFQTELYENPDDFIIGNPEGDITIVEFFDYNCGYCKRALADLNRVISKNPNVSKTCNLYTFIKFDYSKTDYVDSVHLSKSGHKKWAKHIKLCLN